MTLDELMGWLLEHECKEVSPRNDRVSTPCLSFLGEPVKGGWEPLGIYGRKSNGYRPDVRWLEKTWPVARILMMFEHGDLGDLHVLHKCGNGNVCVNVDHLYLDTHRQNMVDKKRDNHEFDYQPWIHRIWELRIRKGFGCVKIGRRIGAPVSKDLSGGTACGGVQAILRGLNYRNESEEAIHSLGCRPVWYPKYIRQAQILVGD